MALGDELLVGNNQGVYAVTAGDATLVQLYDSARCLLASNLRPRRIFVGGRAGLAVLRRVNGRWTIEGAIPGIADHVRTLLKDADSSLWLGTYSKGVQRLRFAAGADLNLGVIGKELTAILDIEQAFERVHRQIDARLDAFTTRSGSADDPESTQDYGGTLADSALRTLAKQPKPDGRPGVPSDAWRPLANG